MGTPTITFISPQQEEAGKPEFTLTVTGTGFEHECRVYFRGQALTTTFVSSTQVTAIVLRQLITSVNTADVVVQNSPGTNSSQSNGLLFIVYATTPYMWQQSQPLTNKYVHDHNLITVDYGSPPTPPTKMVPFTDPTTGTTLMRLTNNADTGSVPPDSLIVYSRYSAINSTGQYMLVHGYNSNSAWVVDLNDGKIVNQTTLKWHTNDANNPHAGDIGENNEIRWDYSGRYPNRVYFILRSEMRFYHMDVVTENGKPTPIRDFSSDFPGAGRILNDVEGDSSNDSRFWAWMVQDPYNGSTYPTRCVIVYDQLLDQICLTLRRADLDDQGPDENHIYKPNMVDMSPSGTHVLLLNGRAYDYGNHLPPATAAGKKADGPHVWRLDGNGCVRVSVDQTHSGWAYGPNGEQYFISQNDRTDWVEAVDINVGVQHGDYHYECDHGDYQNQTPAPGRFRLLFQEEMASHRDIGFHFGRCYNLAKQGWVWMSTESDRTGNPQAQEDWGRGNQMYIKIQDNYGFENHAAGSAAAHVFRVAPSYNAKDETRAWSDVNDVTQCAYRDENSCALDLTGNVYVGSHNWNYSYRGAIPPTQHPVCDGEGTREVMGGFLPHDWQDHVR